MEAKESSPTVIRTAADAAALFAPSFAGAEGEKIMIAYLDPAARLIGLGDYPGTGDGAELQVRQILSEGLRLGAAALIVAHNHPSGDIRPSDADRETTRMLAETARRLGIAIHDHLIFGDGEVSSFRALGLL